MIKRIISIALAATAASALAGCDIATGGADPVSTATPTQASTPNTPNPPQPPSDNGEPATPDPAGGAREVTEETATYLFTYSYPQEAGELPSLVAWLDERLDAERQSLVRDAIRGRAEARNNGFPFNKYSSGTGWQVVADLPGWLSLSSDFDSYQGGAHPNYGFGGIVWDKEADRPIEAMAFFESAAALDGALGARLCAALNAERAERRGMPIEDGSTDSFDACVSSDETNVLLGSSNGQTFDRIGIQIAPYIAGPYVEGSYEFTFGVDDEVLAIVRPEYRDAFTARD